MKRKRLWGLKGRWMLTSVLTTSGIVIFGVILFTLGISSYYRSAVLTGLTAKAQSAAEFFTSYMARSSAEYSQSARLYTESFSDKDVLELQFINTEGIVEVSSSGDTDGMSPSTPDISQALDDKVVGSWTGKSSTGEPVMAVTAPLLSPDGTVAGAMRYMTSLQAVDVHIRNSAAIAAGVGLLIILAVFISNFYFIRTVREPIVELTALAHRIAGGSYGIQAEKKYNDEIGDLIDAVNEMSVKIGESEKTQTEFISSVSHELRTPLTAITGWAETLAYDDAITGDSRRGIQIISKESGRLTKMVENLLEFTRIQDGRFNLNLQKMDVSAELEDAIFTYGELLRQEGITAEYAPPAQEIPLILGDPERLKQVFLNIMDNAAKYGRAAGHFTVTVGATDEWVVIRFRDYGPGIPENELPFVKRKFYKGSSKQRGSGIGLSVCDEIITRHNGLLRIENNSDGKGGVTVSVYLPVINENDLRI
jgi:two-component system OmpR family sensor kinase